MPKKSLYLVQKTGNTIQHQCLVWANDKKEAKRVYKESGQLPFGEAVATKIHLGKSKVIMTKTIHIEY